MLFFVLTTRRYERIHLHRNRDGIVTARLLLHLVPIRHGPGALWGASTITRRARGLSALRSSAPEYARAFGFICAVALVVRAGGRPLLGGRDWRILAHRQASVRTGLLPGARETNAGIDHEHAAYLHFRIRGADWLLLGPLQRLTLKLTYLRGYLGCLRSILKI